MTVKMRIWLLPITATIIFVIGITVGVVKETLHNSAARVLVVDTV